MRTAAWVRRGNLARRDTAMTSEIRRTKQRVSADVSAIAHPPASACEGEPDAREPSWALQRDLWERTDDLAEFLFREGAERLGPHVAAGT